jgi:hypothetical protein
VAGRALEAPGEPCHLQGAVAIAGIVTSAQGTPVRAVIVPGCQPGPGRAPLSRRSLCLR